MLRRLLDILRPKARPVVLVVTTRGEVAMPVERLRELTRR